MFTVDGWFQLFFAAFYLALIFLALKFVIGLRKIDFWVFNRQVSVKCNFVIIFLKHQNIIFFSIICLVLRPEM